VSCGFGLFSGQSLCRAAVGCVLNRVCVVRQWAVFWTEFVSRGSVLFSGQSLCREAVGCFLDRVCVVRHWAIFWTEFVLGGSGLFSGQSLCREAVGCFLDRVCVVRHWAVFWTGFVSFGGGLCSGQSLCRAAVGCVLDIIPCCAKVGCAALDESIFGHLVQLCSLCRDKKLHITQQNNRLHWPTDILVPQMLDPFLVIFDLLIPKMASVFPYQL
jgi:hypothetical protein